MVRIKLELPSHFHFSTVLAVRVSDLNYGNHLGNDRFLAYMQEARMKFFSSLGYSEINLAGAAVIMGDAVVVYKKECFYGDNLKIEVTVSDLGKRSFDLYYKFTRASDNEIVCEGKTGMVCFDYSTRKTVNIPSAFRERFESHPEKKSIFEDDLVSGKK